MNRIFPLLGLAAMLAGTSSAVRAADPGVLTSLDLCDALGISGLTLSSESNCLKISGSVYYEFNWGNYETRTRLINNLAVAGEVSDEISVMDDEGELDWYSYIEAYLRFEAVADSDFGPARAVIDITSYEEQIVTNGLISADSSVETLNTDYAYVAIGDTTVITAGLNDDSIFYEEDDVPFDWLGTASSYYVGDGVAWDVGGGTYNTAGHVITVVSDFGNGFKAGAGLEGLDADSSLVGFVSYSGVDAPLVGHLSFVAGDVLDGTFDDWAIHTGVTASIDAFKASAALALNDSGWWNALFTGEATFDIFTLAATADGNSEDQLGASGSVSAAVTDAITLKAGARWTDTDTNIDDDELLNLRARIEYAVGESLTLGGEAGHTSTGSNALHADASIFDVTADLSWNPVGSGYTATIEGSVNSIGGYKTVFTAEKVFE